MQERFLEERGIAYRVNEFKEGRPTLVFLHGFSSSLSIWAPFEKLFEDTYNILMYDQRGNGKSVRPKTYPEYSLRKHIQDLRALLDELHIESPIIIGFSFGSIIAMEFLRAHPGAAKRAIFIAPVYGLRWRYFVYSTRNFLAYLAQHTPHMPHLNTRLNYAKLQGESDRNPGLTWKHINSTGAREYLWELEQIYTQDTDAHWRELSLPCFLVHGSNDHVIPLRFAVMLERHIPTAKLLVIEGGNHMLPINHVDELSEAIRNAVENY